MVYHLQKLSLHLIQSQQRILDSILPYSFHVRQMQENIAQAIMDADTMSPDGIQARLDELQKKLIRKANSKQDYDAIAELQDFIGSQQSEITEFDESLVRKLIQQITVYDDHLTVRFKSGLEIEINE